MQTMEFDTPKCVFVFFLVWYMSNKLDETLSNLRISKIKNKNNTSLKKTNQNAKSEVSHALGSSLRSTGSTHPRMVLMTCIIHKLYCPWWLITRTKNMIITVVSSVG